MKKGKEYYCPFAKTSLFSVPNLGPPLFLPKAIVKKGTFRMCLYLYIQHATIYIK